MPGAWEIPADIPPDVLIATPSTGIVPMDWSLNLITMQKPPATHIRGSFGAPVHVARNELVRAAMELKSRYIFFVDSDVFPPPYALTRLMSWHLPIVSGLYYAKRGYPAAWRKVPGPDQYEPIPVGDSHGILEVAIAPAGCLLVDMRFFERVPEPWFRWTLEHPDQRAHPGEFSEDFEFCRLAIMHGFKIYMDLGVDCDHEARVRLNRKGGYTFPGQSVERGP